MENQPKPPLVTADDWINVVSATNRVGQLQGIGNIGNSNSYTGRNNSAYIAGLAYWANTTDMRPDDDGKVTMSTHWVDVLRGRKVWKECEEISLHWRQSSVVPRFRMTKTLIQ